MSPKSGRKNSIVDIWQKINKESAAIGWGGPWLRVLFLVILVLLIFLCLLIFPSDLLSFDMGMMERVQNIRLTLKPYTPTPTVTPTKKPTLTLTPTITITPTGKLPSPTSTPVIPTLTFTVTATPTMPHVPLQTLRPDSVYAWQERLTDSWLWRHLYAVGVGMSLATWLVILYIRDVYRIRQSVRSAGLLMRMLLLLPIGTLHFKGGNLVDREGRIVRDDWILVTPQGKIVRKNNKPVIANAVRRTLRLLRIGLPARLIVDHDSCVVIEGSQKQSLVIGPTREKGVILLGFSRVRRGVDLRDSPARLNLRQLSSDGVPLGVEDFQITFSVFRGGQIVQGDIYPYVEEAIFNLVYRFWLDGEWIPEMTARISGELSKFIAARPLVTFLPFISQDQVTSVNLDQAANPFNEFVYEFNSQARVRGIQINWQGGGKWKLPTEADLAEQLENWQKNLEGWLKLPEQLSSEPAGGEYNQSLINLIQQVPLSLLEPLMSPDFTTQAMLTIVEAYRDKLNEALQLYQQRGQTPPSELVGVIDHLNRLILRRIGDA